VGQHARANEPDGTPHVVFVGELHGKYFLRGRVAKREPLNVGDDDGYRTEKEALDVAEKYLKQSPF
jgi:hypothetical protein